MVQNDTVLCSISTRGRYDTTLPLALQACINQSRKPDHIIIFDDNEEPKDLRDNLIYLRLFQQMDFYKIKWEIIFGKKKGQSHNHQIANLMPYKWVWRVDDDCVPEGDVLDTLLKYTDASVGAVGGSILTPPTDNTTKSTGLIRNIDTEPNIQWGPIKKATQVEHLHCSFLYRSGIVDYNLALSRKCHREETIFTMQLRQKGYTIVAVPNAVTWHYKAPSGGIRSVDSAEEQSLYAHDEHIFRNFKDAFEKNQTIVVLDAGMGDHLIYKSISHMVQNPLVYTCHPDIVPGKSIQEALHLYGDIAPYNIYQKMSQWNWKLPLSEAYRLLYVTRLPINQHFR